MGVGSRRAERRPARGGGRMRARPESPDRAPVLGASPSTASPQPVWGCREAGGRAYKGLGRQPQRACARAGRNPARRPSARFASPPARH